MTKRKSIGQLQTRSARDQFIDAYLGARINKNISLSALFLNSMCWMCWMYWMCWILPTVSIVEDKMLVYCHALSYEHAGHSFILDHHDKCWEDVFSTDDLHYSQTYSLPTLSEYNPHDVDEYTNSLNGKIMHNILLLRWKGIVRKEKRLRRRYVTISCANR
ncbi:hypothetical protein BDA99DRAFT_531920 [Phascolomyces articulosus]|uniref:Uncharacterized protein n=1 Tax=Phascolomyces articulosus TaxID=60185 RepID=A0AAD5KAK9_9FUNG|nr:hypothetical protein BDA99DRAFT_531920 [Phascolomyces articulosus]